MPQQIQKILITMNGIFHEANSKQFDSQLPYYFNKLISPEAGFMSKVKSISRHDSIVDCLKSQSDSITVSNNLIKPLIKLSKEPSIENLIIENERQMFHNAMMEDIFWNRPAVESNEISSLQILQSINEPIFIPQHHDFQEQTKGFEQIVQKNNSHIVLSSLASKEYLVNPLNVPERPNMSRPFLRKKDFSVKQIVSDIQVMREESISRQYESNFETKKLEADVSELKSYTSRLENVLTVIKQLKNRPEFQSIDSKDLRNVDINFLKLMFQKAILRKDENN